jgi:hypothetical protein
MQKFSIQRAIWARIAQLKALSTPLCAEIAAHAPYLMAQMFALQEASNGG